MASRRPSLRSLSVGARVGPIQARRLAGPLVEGACMADRMLFIGWGDPVRGAEERAIEVFNEALGILGRKQQEGQIEGFDVALLAPNTDLGGYITVRGTGEQITALREDPEFQRNTLDSTLVVDGIRHVEGYTNEGVATQMAMYQEAIAKVPQRA